ncbi:MAG: site-specific DNA-methyltransferase [Nitrosomonadales bacterium]|nr:site-specific DNA-methyltransferase [Nitrosomonadales bacterium]
MTEDIKLPLTSADLTEALLAQLYDAAPQIFSEGRVDFAKLQAALGEHIEAGAERYGLNWAGKRDAFRNVQVPSVATLRPQPEESVNWDSTENLIIEGDNLEVLKLLQKPYHGKVKMIYIDPPYNTGNEFIYPDNFREGLDEYLRYTGQLGEDGTATSSNKDTSGRYHSNWLNMMYPRLFLARNLLKEDGVIFVSINDAEMHNLRLLMDEVFSEEMFIGALVWKSRHNVDSRNKTSLSSDHEYVLCYGRKITGQQIDENKYSNPDNDPRGPWMSDNMVGLATKEQRPNLHYELVNPETGVVHACPEKGWRYDRNTMAKKIGEQRILWPVNPEGRPRHKKFLNEIRSQFTGFSSLLDVPSTSAGTQEVRDLFGAAIFDFPKPAGLLQELIRQGAGSSECDIVLDFFAGSGTTAHAVLDLNQEDGGNRKFILVQLPEKTDNPQYPTIAHITRERVRRVITKLQESRHSRAGGNPAIQNALDLNPLDSRLRGNDEEGRGNDDAGDLGFRAFKLDSSNFKIWRSDKAPQSAEQLAEQLSLYADNVLAERGDQDRLYELILKSGRPLSARVERITIGQRTAFAVEENALLICLEQHLDRDTLRALFARKPLMVLCLDTAFDGNDALKTNTVLEAQSHGIIFKTV